MSISKKMGIAIIVGVVVLGGIYFTEQVTNTEVDIFVSTAQAKVGRPLTPVSVAGVARRTSRRN
jgi:hypothetical protein